MIWLFTNLRYFLANTEEYCIPIIEEKSKLKYNKDFFAGYSPERINPGDKPDTCPDYKKNNIGF